MFLSMALWRCGAVNVAMPSVFDVTADESYRQSNKLNTLQQQEAYYQQRKD